MEVVKLYSGFRAVKLEMLLETEVARGGVPRLASGQSCCVVKNTNRFGWWLTLLFPDGSLSTSKN